MIKKSAILGLVLLVVGGAVFVWVRNERSKDRENIASCKLKYGSEADEYLRQYNEWLQLPPDERLGSPLALDGYSQAKTKAELEAEQHGRLTADLDRLATGELDANPFADVLYGPDWQSEVQEYKKRKEFSEFTLTASIVCTAIGGAALGWCLLAWIIRFVPAIASRLGISSGDTASGSGDVESVEAGDMDSSQPDESAEQPSRVPLDERMKRWNTGEDRDYSAVHTNSGRLSSQTKKAREPAVRSAATESVADGQAAVSEKGPSAEQPTQKVKKIPLVIPGGKATKGSGAPGHRERSLAVEKSLRDKTESLEKQMVEFRQMAQQTKLEHSEPLNVALKDLTQQVSAIREYAANQQERVEKLQDGYDWNIIRTFCLRVIRCIDNLQGRIDLLLEKGIETDHLEEVRDELIFSLESSGIEQFEPEINSDYRGQEKTTEAVKEKEPCTDSKQAGKIAKVIRPGYQYFINEDCVKVVRTAQVKLFG